MDKNADAFWNEMLAEFRALGGVADNIRLGVGPFGRGLFPIDPNKPVQISIPNELLVPLEDVKFENDVFCIADHSPLSARGRQFIERYEQDFSWGPGRSETERLLHRMNELPEKLRPFLTTELGLGRFFAPISPALVRHWFFATRVIRAGDRRVIMPIIELANHGGAARYNTTGGVSLSGAFEQEVLVRYATPTDPYDLFINWLFAPNEIMAFSLAVQGAFGGRQFDIRREFDDQKMPLLPKVRIEDDRIVIGYILLGHKRLPRTPKGLFRRAMQSLQVKDVDETYDFIQMMNRNKFLNLLAALEGFEQPAAAMLRTLALNQLRALSYHYGSLDR